MHKRGRRTGTRRPRSCAPVRRRSPCHSSTHIQKHRELIAGARTAHGVHGSAGGVKLFAVLLQLMPGCKGRARVRAVQCSGVRRPEQQHAQCLQVRGRARLPSAIRTHKLPGCNAEDAQRHMQANGWEWEGLMSAAYQRHWRSRAVLQLLILLRAAATGSGREVRRGRQRCAALRTCTQPPSRRDERAPPASPSLLLRRPLNSQSQTA